MKTRILVGLGVVLAASAIAALTFMKTGPLSIPWTSDYEAAFQQAGERDGVVLTYLHTDWCSYCKQME